MTCGIFRNVFYCLGNVVNHSYSDDVVAKLGGIILLGGVNNAVAKDSLCLGAAPYLYIMLVKLFLNSGKKFFCNVFVYKQCFDSVANGGTLSLGIVGDIHSHFNVSAFINVQMAVACACFDNGDGCVLGYSLDKTCTASGDKQIKVLVALHKLGGDFTGGIINKLNDILGEACLFHGISHYLADALVGVVSLLAASENNCIACFKAECGGVSGNIGARFIYHSDNAHRNTDFGNSHAVGANRTVIHFADRVFQLDKLVNSGSNALYPVLVEHKSVLHGNGHSVFFCSSKVFLICFDYLIRIFNKRTGYFSQS